MNDEKVTKKKKNVFQMYTAGEEHKKYILYLLRVP